LEPAARGWARSSDHSDKLSRMADRQDLIATLKKQTEIDFVPATPGGIDQLRSLKVPKEAIAFYREAEPVLCAEIDGVRLWPIKNIIEENTDYVPGCYIREHGYLVFSTTLFGDTFCFDLNAASPETGTPVVLIAHDWFWEEITAEQIAQLKKPTAVNFEAFLEAFLADSIDIDPNYPSM